MPNEESEISFEPPRSMFGTWLGIVLLFAVFGLFVWAVMGATPHGNSYEEKRATARLEKLKTVHEEANTALAGYAWVDKSKGVARLPIQRAMELSVADLAQKKPTAANPIPPEAAPAGPQTSAPGAPSPAPSASAAEAGASPKASAIVGEKSEIHGQPSGAANPPNAAPGTQPGPSATPAASPPAPSSQAQPNPSASMRTPVPAPAGTPIPLPGATP